MDPNLHSIQAGTRPIGKGFRWWCHAPWMTALFLAPFFVGLTRPEGQALVGGLIGVSLLCLAAERGSGLLPACPTAVRWAAAALFILPLVPWPADLLGGVQPERLALARAFPVTADAAPRWLPLTLSFANSLQRIWELALMISVAVLARHACREPGFARALALLAGLTVGLLFLSDVWYRATGRRALLGLWPVTWGTGAGTFANQNHFANWIYVACLFGGGWLLRQLYPLHAVRLPSAAAASSRTGDAVFLGVALILGLGIGLASGSRGGLLAWGCGIACWGVLLAHRSHSRRRWLLIGLALGAGCLLLAVAGELVLGRLTEARLDLTGRYPKLEIWQQSWLVWRKFPWLGTGWGTFVTAFNYYKAILPGSTCWHAENEYVQLLLETGLLGWTVFAAGLFWMVPALVRALWRERWREPELAFGAAAALAAYAIHGLVEFVWQMPANGMLAAALLGFLLGQRDQGHRPVVAPLPGRIRVCLNTGWAVALITMSGLQGLAAWHWLKAERLTSASAAAEQVRLSLRYWPWSASRHIALARLEVRLLDQREASETRTNLATQALRIRQGLNRAIATDPFNWELHLERAWLDLAYSTNTLQAIDEARQAGRLNPLQAQIPLRFARHFSERNPAVALDFLRQAPLRESRDLQQALRLAWTITGETASLWTLIPDTVPGWLALGDFAMQEKLLPLAAQAYLQLTNRMAPEFLAQKLLSAGRPDGCLAMLALTPPAPASRLLKAKALFELGRYPEAIQQAESVWLGDPRRSEILASAVGSQSASLRDGELIFLAPAARRDLPRLRQLAGQQPRKLRLLWMVFQTERELQQHAPAAQSAIALAGRLIEAP
jgi:O-antigen ligase/tetratricopeptide (TPR) repeat protein